MQVECPQQTCQDKPHLCDGEIHPYTVVPSCTEWTQRFHLILGTGVQEAVRLELIWALEVVALPICGVLIVRNISLEAGEQMRAVKIY